MHKYGTVGEGRHSRLKDLFPSFSTSKYAQAKRSRGHLPPGVQEPSYWIKDQGPVKVEAKVWLANQRTFIKWQHVSVLLGTLGLGLYNAAGENNNVARALAVVYTLVALFTGAWGYGIYMWRVSLIQKRSGKDFDAITGPVVVCLGLIVALILNFAFKVSLEYFFPSYCMTVMGYTNACSQYQAALEERKHGHQHASGNVNVTQGYLPYHGDL